MSGLHVCYDCGMTNNETPADVIAAAEYETWSHALCDPTECTHDEHCFDVAEGDDDED